MKIILLLLAAVLIAGPAVADQTEKAPNPDGQTGTIWVEFGGETAINGEHRLDGDFSPASGDVKFHAARIGLGTTISSRTTFLLSFTTQRSVFVHANLGANPEEELIVDQVTRINSVAVSLRFYLANPPHGGRDDR